MFCRVCSNIILVILYLLILTFINPRERVFVAKPKSRILRYNLILDLSLDIKNLINRISTSALNFVFFVESVQ